MGQLSRFVSRGARVGTGVHISLNPLHQPIGQQPRGQRFGRLAAEIRWRECFAAKRPFERGARGPRKIDFAAGRDHGDALAIGGDAERGVAAELEFIPGAYGRAGVADGEAVVGGARTNKRVGEQIERRIELDLARAAMAAIAARCARAASRLKSARA